MSTFVLKREYALQMPTNYVDVDRDEMEYVDGGGIVKLTISKETLSRLARVACIIVGTVIGGLLGYYVGNVPGAIIGATFGFVGGFIAGNLAAGKILTTTTFSANVNGYSGHYYI
jgi:outer membrane lipoprotein SlyB